MADQKVADLVIKLKQSTEGQKVPWEQTASESMFQATLSGFVVQIAQIEDRFSESVDYTIRILNKDGQLIDIVFPNQLQKTGLFQDQNAYDVMSEIFALARRKALGGDQALDAIISQL